jgi:hypothetical protein
VKPLGNREHTGFLLHILTTTQEPPPFSVQAFEPRVSQQKKSDSAWKYWAETVPFFANVIDKEVAHKE